MSSTDITNENPFFDNFDNDEPTNAADESTDDIGASVLAQAFAVDNNIPASSPSSSSSNNIFGGNQFGNSSNNSNNNAKKYYIKDLLWLISFKLYRNEKLENGETALITVGFNSTYDNMRITFLQPSSETFTESAIIRLKTKSLTTVNLFSETCAAIKYSYNSSSEKPVMLMAQERLIQSGNWQPNKTRIELDKKNNKITIHTISPSDSRNSSGTKYKFTLEGWQVPAFIDACNFMLNGGAWSVSSISQYFSPN